MKMNMKYAETEGDLEICFNLLVCTFPSAEEFFFADKPYDSKSVIKYLVSIPMFLKKDRNSCYKNDAKIEVPL